MSILAIIEIICIGLVTGTITSLIGASGVTVVVPSLTLLFGINSHLAIGTSLLVDVITSIVVSIDYIKHKNVRLQASIWITVGSIIGAQLGSHWAGIISDTKLSGIFAIMLIISGISTLRKKNNSFDPNKGVHFKSKFAQTMALLGLGFGIGIISGLVGAGGGVIDYYFYFALSNASSCWNLNRYYGNYSIIIIIRLRKTRQCRLEIWSLDSVRRSCSRYYWFTLC